MVHLSVGFEESLTRSYFEDFVREIEIDVVDVGDAGQEYLVGKVAVYQFMFEDAFQMSMPIGQVMDAHSAELDEVFKKFLRRDGELRKQLDIEELIKHILVIHRMVIHPDAAGCRQGVFTAIANMFDIESLTVTWRGMGGATDKEMNEVGFDQFPDSTLVYRRSVKRAEFSDSFPDGEDVDVAATPEHEEWVLDKWK